MYKLDCKTLKKGNRIKLTGELTIYSAENIYKELDTQFLSNNNLLLDCAGVSEIDTAGAQLLLMLSKFQKDNNKLFQLEKMSSNVEDFVNLFNLKEKLNSENADE